MTASIHPRILVLVYFHLSNMFIQVHCSVLEIPSAGMRDQLDVLLHQKYLLNPSDQNGPSFHWKHAAIFICNFLWLLSLGSEGLLHMRFWERSVVEKIATTALLVQLWETLFNDIVPSRRQSTSCTDVLRLMSISGSCWRLIGISGRNNSLQPLRCTLKYAGIQGTISVW